MSGPDTSRDRYLEHGFWSETETLQTRIASTAKSSPDRLAAVDAEDRTLTYAQLDAHADELAAGLRALGVDDGDVVGIQLPNRVEALVAMSAVERARGIVCPLMPLYRTRELEHVARVGGMKVLFVPGTYRQFDHNAMAGELLARGLIEHAVTLDDAPEPSGMHLISTVMASGRDVLAHVALPEPDPDADAALMFTSGTTGAPKGVLHSHNTMLSGNRILSRVLGLTGDDVIFVPSVVGHSTGYVWGMRFALYLGTRSVLMDMWDPARGARLVAREGCTWTMVAPTFVQDLLDAFHRDPIDVGSLTYVSCGGAAPPTDLHARVEADLDCVLLRIYGQTEAFLSSHCLPADPVEKLTGTEGRALPGVELRVVGDDGAPAAPGEAGELHARGPHRCVGLLGKDGLRRLGPDDWMPSGDLASIDADGFLSIRGRIKEFINRGGVKYSPVEVEDLLHRHPAVARVAVVAVPDERLGERGCACVVPREGAVVALEDLVGYLRDAGLAPFKWPERVEIFDDLPRTPSGKVQKHTLQRLLVERSAREAQVPGG